MIFHLGCPCCCCCCCCCLFYEISCTFALHETQFLHSDFDLPLQTQHLPPHQPRPRSWPNLFSKLGESSTGEWFIFLFFLVFDPINSEPPPPMLWFKWMVENLPLYFPSISIPPPLIPLFKCFLSGTFSVLLFYLHRVWLEGVVFLLDI